MTVFWMAFVQHSNHTERTAEATTNFDTVPSLTLLCSHGQSLSDMSWSERCNLKVLRVSSSGHWTSVVQKLQVREGTIFKQNLWNPGFCLVWVNLPAINSLLSPSTTIWVAERWTDVSCGFRRRSVKMHLSGGNNFIVRKEPESLMKK